MRYEFLKKEGNDNLLLIFGGWSTLPGFYRGLEANGWDTLAVTSYENFKFPSEILDSYSTIGIVAWSMGVFAAQRVSLPIDRIAFAVAVNGTLHPVSDEFGIPLGIYRGTLDNLNPLTLKKFRKRMGGSNHSLHQWSEPSEEEIEELKNELKFILESTNEQADEDFKTFPWSRAYVSREDRIFPFENQLKEWKRVLPEEAIIILDAPHLPDFSRIVGSIIIPKSRIATKFEKSLNSYEDSAIPQRKIANHLTGMAPGQNGGKVLEIGQGSGLFSRLISQKLKPREIDFIDLYATTPLRVAPNENYIIADAEEWVIQKSKEDASIYDAIVSASALQWFVNPDVFFKSCHKLLKPGGFLLFSTFSPSNLDELAPANPYKMLYRTRQSLQESLKKLFSSVVVEDEKIEISFDSKRDLLSHLVATGVGASSAATRPLKELLPLIPKTLTYTPLYFLATK